MAQIILPTRQAPEREKIKRDPMQDLLQGLQIAGNVFGIASNISTLQSQAQQRDLAAKAGERAEVKAGMEAEAFKTAQKRAGAAERRAEEKHGVDILTKTIEAPEGQAGTQITLTTPEGTQVTALRVPKPPAKQIQKNAFAMTPEQREFWLSRGVRPEQIQLVESGFGGRNPAGTLNSMAERDEPTTQELRVIRDFEEADFVLNDALNSAKDKWVGPIDGRVPDALAEPDEVAFRAKVQRFSDAYRKAITGAGASQQEVEMLMSRLPQPTDTFVNFKAKANQFLKEGRDKKKLWIQALERGGKFMDPFKQKGAIDQYIADTDQPIQTTQGAIQVTDDTRDAAIQELKRRRAAAQR